MIEINLLPKELIKEKGKKIGREFLNQKYFLYAIPLILGLLIFLHICLTVVYITKNSQLSLLNNKWQKLEPQRKILEEFKKEYDVLSADAQLIQQLIKQRINWSQKLNKLSSNLPAGVWFNEINATLKDFNLTGSVISLQKEEMTLINKFMDNLKSDSSFFKDFNNLELSSAQRKLIGGYEITDFVLSGSLKSK